MKTAVDTVFVGKERQYNRRFLQMCSHNLVEPVACTPAAGWEKGQVENQVGLVRERFFTPRLRFKTYDDLNAWLVDKCLVWARAHAHPEQSDKTIWEVFEAERSRLVPYRGRFDGFHALPASVSKTCLVRFCQWRRDFPQKWRRKIPQSGGLAISRGHDRRLRFLAAGRDASGSAEWDWRRSA